MGTVSASIDTLIRNVQNAASEMTSEVLGSMQYIYDYLPDPDEFGVLPVVSTLPANELTSPDNLLQMLKDAASSLSEIGAGIPPLASLVGAPTSVALDKYMSYADKYKALIEGRMSLITDVNGRAFPIAGYVKQEAEAVDTRWSPALWVPPAALTAFPVEVTTLALENSDVLYERALIEEKIIQSSADAELNQLAVKAQLLETMQLLEFANTALQGCYAILRKTIVSPEDLLRIFTALSSARTSVSVGLADNRAAYATTQMEYINAVIGYYDVFAKLETLRLDVAGLEIERDSQYKMLQATMYAGAASAAGAIAASGYSAARVGFVLSEKAFS